MAYKPIEDYGVIGDMHSVALVAHDGSIDWCCLPYFDSPSVFAAILDDKKGGYFKISPTHEGNLKQMYLPETNVLVSRFLSQQGVGEVIDFMPVRHQRKGKEEARWHQIVRIAQAVRGEVNFRLECFPAYDFGRQQHELTVTDRGAVFQVPGIQFGLISDVQLRGQENGVVAEFTLQQGECATFIFRHDANGGNHDFLDACLDGQEAQRHTVQYWRSWIAHGRYEGRWREMVDRSALVLKLLTFEPTGAIVASPTCSLPEEIGGVRNWDYRYTWIRDAAFTTYAFMRLGYTEEAAKFMKWLQDRVKEQDTPTGPLQTMYTIHGSPDLPEETLDHLDGYLGSRPVRVGNAASRQLQLDIYGELIDSIYLYDKYGTPIPYDSWNQLRRMLDWIADNWERPDESIWEVRGGPQQFVYSKMQCWVALDRGLRLSNKRSLPLQWQRILSERDRIYETIMKQGWNAERKSFVQYFGSDALDASNLLMPLVLFLSPTDPRMLGTLDRTMEELVSDSLVYRYEIGRGAGDGLTGREGTFSMCTFWLVEALARAGRLEESRLIFEKMLTYANHVGLYGEEVGPSGEALGNYPQAFTHLGLISAAFSLNRHLQRGDSARSQASEPQ